MYDKLTAKVNNIDTSTFVLKTKYQADKTELEKNFWCKLILLKLNELEKKNPDVSSLATKNVSTAVENKMPDVSSLAIKTVSLKRNLLIIIMTNILLLQSLIFWFLMFLL